MRRYQTSDFYLGIFNGDAPYGSFFSSVRGGGLCLCRRGFNRRLILIEEWAVKITLFSSVRGGGLCLCRRGFNRRLIWIDISLFLIFA